MKIYLNLKTNYGTETVDQVNREDFNSFKEYKAELNRLIYEYHICGMPVYKSQRACKDWN